MAGKRYYTSDDLSGVTPSRLKRLGRAKQLEYMEAWFREYYEDPANLMPRDDGRFVYPWGGPYDPFDELGDEFGEIVPEDRIQELATELIGEHVEWAPTGRKQRENEEIETTASEDAAAPVPSGWQETGTNMLRRRYHVPQFEQPPQPLPLLNPGVQDPPTAAGGDQPPTLSPEQAPLAAADGGRPPMSRPGEGDIAGAVSPDTIGGAAATANAGFFNFDIRPQLTGVEAEGEDAATQYVKIYVKRLLEAQYNAPFSLSPFAADVLNDLLQSASGRQQQRPAAYRFELRDGKIDVLPEPPEPRDREFAVDTYDELVAKARELFARLSGTNSAQRLCNSVERLLSALGNRFDDLRPGVLLSRSRSIEADRAAFADELFPDALALMDDTLQTLRDLLAAFPIVRRIEAEGLALQLDRNAEAIPAIQQEMVAVEAAAAQSEAVTEDALHALAQTMRPLRTRSTR